MHQTWKDSIYRQREELAYELREPLAQLGAECAPAWGDREHLNGILAERLATVPYCSCLYVLGTDGVQVCDNIGPGRGRARALRA